MVLIDNKGFLELLPYITETISLIHVYWLGDMTKSTLTCLDKTIQKNNPNNRNMMTTWVFHQQFSISL